MRFQAAFLLLLSILFSLAACTSKAPLPDAKRYHLEGKVLEVDQGGKQLRVDHKDIKGFMDAMTMTYPVQDASAMQTVKTGDEISADVVVARDSFWLENVKETGAASATPAPAAGPAPPAKKP